MKALQPYQAAALADDVYALTRLSTIEDAIKYLKAEHGDYFDFSPNNMLKGKTGGPGFIKCRTAFGFALIGKQNSKFAGQAFIMFRGTQYLADWLTNLNISVSRTRSGQPVHDGFNTAFKSMLPHIKAFVSMAVSKRVTRFHCIGHSLGGALATICGEWIKSAHGMKPYIYTFGSPRVGLYDFSNYCTTRISDSNIFRAYHRTDVVPMIPPWPYVHTPVRGQDYYIPSPGLHPGAEWHDMGRYYNSVEDHSWAQLAGFREQEKTDKLIETWLKHDAPVALTITSIEWLSDALIYVVKKCLSGAAQIISKSYTTTMTLLDQLALILHKGINIAESISSWVGYLIVKIMKMLGMKRVIDTASMTREFIRSLLAALHGRVNQYAKKALSDVMVKGRAL
ncbi:lipase family protein [Aliikangiella sp. G2MR2-5]|uniref:lipase family protein n=1 Tax=Aliikangiella sp. G2MR2-5 TaxID=2788943 RepID=UPI0018ABB05C|nr:lipase family protein [Aliikangiella sp. G2MR2-5]